MQPSTINMALAQLKSSSAKDTSGKPLVTLESLFDYSHSLEGEFGDFVKGLVKTTFWEFQNYSFNPFPSLCLELANVIDSQNGALGHLEPAYHSRKHFQDVCLALTALLDQPIGPLEKFKFHDAWKISKEEAWILLLCAISHDFGHNGAINKYPFELEKKTVGLVQEFLEGTSLSLCESKEIIGTIEPIVLATDPRYLPTLLDKFVSGENLQRSDYLSMLMVEADLLASALPKRGKILGERLSEEWQLTNPEAAAVVQTKKGRLNFLEHIRFISPQAQALGIEDIRKISIDQIKE